MQMCFLIEDDIDDQEIFAFALQRVDASIELRSAKDGAEGLKKLKEDVSYIPQYIFLDINMPKMNGLQCLPEIKKLQHLRHAKVIMYSTASDEEMKRVTKQLGADEFLVKPSKMSILVNNLMRILEKS